MATCEKCGTTFTPIPQAGEVVSLRILCPKCEAAKRAERQARLQGSAVSRSPASKPADPQQPRRAPAPAASGASPTPAGIPRSAAAVRTAPPATPPPAPKPPAPSASHAPHATPHKHDAPVHPPGTHRESYVQKEQDRTTMVGGIVAGILVLITVIVVVIIGMKHKAEAARALARSNEVEEFLVHMQKFNLESEEDCKSAIDLGERETSKYTGEKTESEIGGIIARAKSSLERIHQVRDLKERLDNIEKQLAEIATLTSEQLTEIRRKLVDIEKDASVVGAEFTARVGVCRNKIDDVFVEKLHDEAKSFADQNPDKLRLALTKYQHAEDEALSAFEKVFKKDKEREPIYQKRYTDIIAESDALCEKVFTPAIINNTPWTDLLAGDQAKNWNPSQVQGFTQRIENGVLDIVGPDKDANREAIMSIGDREQWRDFTMEMEFTIESGETQIYFRIGKRADNTVESYNLTTELAGGLQKNTKYTAVGSFIGSKLSFKVGDFDPYESDVKWTQSRRGGIALKIPDGTKMRITKFRVKELRKTL